MFEELNNERKNVAEDLKLQAASRLLREAASQLDDRLMPIRGDHEEYVKRNHEEDLKEICILAVAAGLSAAAIIALIVLVTKLIRKGHRKADEKLEALKQELEEKIEKA